MTFSQQTPLLSEITGEGPISKHHLAYLCERARNRHYDYVLRKFLEAQEQRGLTQADLARRLGKGADRINKALGAPGNWTFDTYTEFLIGIAGEEPVPSSEPLSGRSARNHTQNDHLSSCLRTETTPVEFVNVVFQLPNEGIRISTGSGNQLELCR